MNDENLYRALSDISDTFIDEANEVREGDTLAVCAENKRRKIAFVSGTIAAACACACALTLAIVLPLQTNTSNGDLPSASSPGISDPGNGDTLPSSPSDDESSDRPGNNPGLPQEIYGLGSTQSSDVLGSIRFSDKTAYSVTFELEITTNPYNYEIYVELFGTEIVYTYNDDGSIDKRYSKDYIITTDPNYDYYGSVVLENALVVTVNGVPSPNCYIPNEVGNYTIVLDYSAVKDISGNIRMDRVDVWFWDFYILDI